MSAVSTSTSQSQRKIRIDPVLTYTTLISIVGAVLLLWALLNLPEDRTGLIIFALMAFVAELANVPLLYNSRESTVSVSLVISLAAILALGPAGGILVEFACGVAHTISDLSHRELRAQKKRASLLRRSAFNTGMFVIANAAAGIVYSLTGGSVDNILHLTNLVPLALTALTHAMVNLLLLLSVISLQTRANPWKIWRSDFQWTVPITFASSAIGGGVLALAYAMFGLLGALVFFLPIFFTGYSFVIYDRNSKIYIRQLEGLNQDLSKANTELLKTLGAVIDAYDVYTFGHTRQVTVYAGALAEKIGLPKAEQEKIVRAALVHDIGKIGVEDRIIGKEGILTNEEREMMRRHSVIGAEILSPMEGLKDLVPLVRHHHERYDGSGYPDAIRGEAIPLGARVIALADALEAMLSDRSYRKGIPLADVVAEVRRCSGTQFDPQMVATFLALAEERGAAFFINSASGIDHTVTSAGDERARRFLKRSLLK